MTLPAQGNRPDWPRLVKQEVEKLKRRIDEQPTRAQAWFFS